MAGQLDSRCDYDMLFDSIDSCTPATTFTKAQKRWRVAYTAIYFALHLSKDFVPETKIHFTKAQKRWRLAYIAIYSSRVMLSLVREIVTDERSLHHRSGSSHSSAYTILDIQPASSHLDVDENIKGACLIEIDDVEDSCFCSIDQSKLTKMVKEKDLSDLRSFRGLEGLAKALQTDPEDGISSDDRSVSLRRSTFGSNTYQKPLPKGFVFFMLEAFKDTTILILLGCAALSLGFGLNEHGAAEGWYEGGSIFMAVFLVVAVSAVSNSIFDVVVGDVVFLTIGDQVPADGLFMKGHALQIDESSMTGESDHVEVDRVQNPFLLSGSKVVDGYAHMLVTSVGMNTAWGKMMSSIAHDSNEQTPLQARLEKLTSSIGKGGLAVASLVLVVLLIRYFTGNTKDESGKQEFNGKTKINDVFNSVVRVVADAVTIVVVAIPEGLPLAVTLTLAYSMKRMMKDQAMVRKLSACETMGSATVIVNVAALVINFIAAVSAGEVPLTAVQLLWVNLIMDTLGALALATERPTDELMHRPPVGRTEPLITNIMWRNLLAQALYQIAILLILQFWGKSIFNVSGPVRNTLIFNTFVLCQVFNEFNSRKLEKKNVFTGLHRNRLFIAIVGITIALQIVMVEFLLQRSHFSAI